MPISNLERMIAFAEEYEPLIVQQQQRIYGSVQERPTSILLVVASEFIDIVERIADAGLWQEYTVESRVGPFPIGRIDVFETAWRSARARTPQAVSTAFTRSTSTSANACIFFALEKLHRLIGDKANLSLLSRIASCQRQFATSLPNRILKISPPREIDRICNAIPEAHALYLGSGPHCLIQKMTVAAIQMAEKKVWEQRS